ncbi:MAG TPA: ABC transporter permease [Burkholderiaceae bacterium]|nr:ABC transporter permease [Burkholderiaceae bacterium]
MNLTLALLRTFSWPEWRLHPWRQGMALLAVSLGVALAFSVHLINASALAEFDSAVRAVDGSPDFELRPVAGSGFDESLYERVANLPQVEVALPVVEAQVTTHTLDGGTASLRLVGIDALQAPKVAPQLVPQPDAGASRLAAVDPGGVFLNAAARQRLGTLTRLRIDKAGAGTASLQVHGTVPAGGAPLAVLDIAGAQQVLDMPGRLSRIAVRLKPGADRAQVLGALQLPAGVRVSEPSEASERMGNLTRAYRVNLTVLALVALFTGAFLVFSVFALSVARRIPQFALLGVLGLSAGERLGLVLAEGVLLGVLGSALGLGLGTVLADVALRWLGGDLGGGYFQGLRPALHLDGWGVCVYGVLGVLAALVGAWVPARQAQALAPAQALKGLGLESGRHAPAWLGPLLLVLAAGLAALPPIGELPLAAYLSVAVGLLGGIACVPVALALLLHAVPEPRHALALLAIQRTREQRAQASVAVAGVVVSLSLAVALTVMVGSFRQSVDDWLQQLLPADLYLRLSTPSGSVPAPLPAGFMETARRITGVQRVQGQRALPLQLDPRRPSVWLLARVIGPDPARAVPLVGPLLAEQPGMPSVLASEAMVPLYGASPGHTLKLPLPDGRAVTVFVRGVWRDYARQHGALMIELDDYRRFSGDLQLTDLALWLAPGADLGRVEQALRASAADVAMDMASTAELRQISLRIFDRSFAVTRYLQAVAIGIGLFGIAASFSAQVLARRKEFGMLGHLGVTRGEILALVAAEGAVWTAAGTLLGLLLGLAVSVVLVYVVNPQSFHWTMEMSAPWLRLAGLCVAVLLAGTATALVAGRAAAAREMALAVKEDW